MTLLFQRSRYALASSRRVGVALVFNTLAPEVPGSRADAHALRDAYGSLGFDVFDFEDSSAEVRHQQRASLRIPEEKAQAEPRLVPANEMCWSFRVCTTSHIFFNQTGHFDLYSPDERICKNQQYGVTLECFSVVLSKTRFPVTQSSNVCLLWLWLHSLKPA